MINSKGRAQQHPAPKEQTSKAKPTKPADQPIDDDDVDLSHLQGPPDKLPRWLR
jgi:hypothetical protein